MINFELLDQAEKGTGHCAEKLFIPVQIII